MGRRHLTAALAAALTLAGGGVVLAATPPATWDDLVRVPSKRLDVVYLLPGASFKAYTKVMIEPTQIAFRKDWQREYNRQSMKLSSRISDADIETAIADGGKAATEIFAKTFAAGGYPVVTAPGPDVLRVRTAVINLSVNAPDTMSSKISSSRFGDAGDRGAGFGIQRHPGTRRRQPPGRRQLLHDAPQQRDQSSRLSQRGDSLGQGQPQRLE